MLMFTTVWCTAKFLCQRMSSLIYLQQTHCDSVHRRANRATIQLHGTGSPFLTQNQLTVHLLVRTRKDGCSAPWKNTSHLPAFAKPDVSFCYIKIKFTDKKANVLADKGKLTGWMSRPGNGVPWYLHWSMSGSILKWGPSNYGASW